MSSIEPPSGIRLATGDEPQRPRFDPYTGEAIPPEPPEPPEPAEGSEFWESQRQAPPTVAPTVPRPPLGMPSGPANPYAPTGWQRKIRSEFDVTLPSGQLCSVMRLEREDLFRMDMMSYLDTFAPILMDDTISAEERERRVRQKVQGDSNATANLFMAIDQVVMAATVKPRITDDPKMVDYGTAVDWSNQNFVATAFINDIEMNDRFAIFSAAFGRSMDDLKSVPREASSVASMAD